MAEFKKGHGLNAAIEDIISKANQRLILTSPYIKLDRRYEHELRSIQERGDIEVIVCFGKSDGNRSSSIHDDAWEFLIQFPNIKIYHHNDLHGKFYANEREALITSMNLYSYSQANNHELGVLVKSGEGASGEIYQDGQNWVNGLIREAELVFEATKKTKPVKKRSPLLRTENRTSAKAQKWSVKNPGFCIRTGSSIPFNPNRPFSYESFAVWSQFGDPYYPENFCHYSGEKSFGSTSMERPILREFYHEAMSRWQEEGNPFEPF